MLESVKPVCIPTESVNFLFLQIPQADSDPPDSSTNATQEIDESVGREGRDSADESDKETSMLVVEDNEDETTEKVLDMFLNVLDSEVCACSI